MNELRIVIFVFALIGVGLCALIGIDLADDGDAESIKGVIMAGFAMLSAATVGAGALSGLRGGPPRSPQVTFGPHGEATGPVPPQSYGSPAPHHPGPGAPR